MAKLGAWALALGLLTLVARPALAEGEMEACLASYESAQKLRAQSKLLGARDALQKCANPECPKMARADCERWLDEIRADIPSIVIVATDEAGNDLSDVRVSADGRVVAETLSGQAIELDPGPRTLTFERAGLPLVERKIILRIGERNRRVPVQIVPPPPATPPPPPKPNPPEEEGPTIPTATWVLGGIGVVGLASFGYFALDGTSRQSDLDACRPNCSSDDVSATRRSYLLADISLGVGVLALGGAAYFYFTRPEPSTAAGFSFGASATPGGGFAALHGRL